MANRPVFQVLNDGANLITVVNTSFDWNRGFAKSQKQKNIRNLHQAFVSSHSDCNILEISTKSELELGIKLSAFNLILNHNGKKFSVESAFQAGKIFENGMQYVDLLDKSAREAKRDARLHDSGRICSFEFDGKIFPIVPKTLFYDYLYITALNQNTELAMSICKFDAFTDIEFNPLKSINCQARSAAIYVSLVRRNRLDSALSDMEKFKNIVYG